MKKFVPLDKQQKKKQKEYHDKQRNKWEINPTTQVIPDKRKEKREKDIINSQEC